MFVNMEKVVLLALPAKRLARSKVSVISRAEVCLPYGQIHQLKRRYSTENVCGGVMCVLLIHLTRVLT